MNINAKAIKWAISFIDKHSDGDLFPKILETSPILQRADEFTNLITSINPDQLLPGPFRRFIVPKDELSYRQATQLDIQDSILLTAIIFQFGMGIEKRRLSPRQIFSYRFNPKEEIGLYNNKTAWNDFWTVAFNQSRKSKKVLYCDIADFYNQIYHHTLENQIIESGFPEQIVKWILKLITSTTAGVSRGIPIGPHAMHLLAEATLIPVDNSLKSKGVKFLRYADDILIFCNSDAEIKKNILLLASVLDKQQRLMLQKHKTKVFSADEFQDYCSSMLEDRPISLAEDSVLNLIRKYSAGNPYASISYEEISEDDWLRLTDELIESIILEYLNADPVDYIRLRWFYRRLTQIGHPGGVKVSLDNLIKLGPCFSNICQYIASIQSIPPKKWKSIGSQLIKLLKSKEVKNSEYYRLLILSIFSKNAYINHFSKLTEFYQSSEPFVRREIILAGMRNKAFDWLRELKENYSNMDSWQKMAYIFSISGLPKDEKNYFLKKNIGKRPIEITLSNWSKSR
ncbi:RNA-directed DNA polymerase [Leptospira wolffii]|uniref:RNA-directed DNA polymerase n=1 Tax=Leptospira wolffii TaxID=409998 RepID=UPI00030BA3C4|nr:RNA-directed DNA polymerase [Leptospira wolffii]EPG64665.1 RNA-directed DNA polymerase [Leptospira wolffii serovar Khorat str. Khorat-H2]